MAAWISIALLLLVAALAVSWYAVPGPWARALIAAGRRRAGLMSRSATVEGVRWHWLEGGAGPTVVLVHGFGADADNWLLLAAALRGRYRLLIPTLPGFGLSEPPDTLSFDLDTQVERLAAFLDDRGVRECRLVGNSMGGWIAARLAERRPGAVRAVALLNPLGVAQARVSPVLRAVETGVDSPFEVTCLEDYRRRVIGPMFVRPPPMPYPLQRWLLRHALRTTPHARRMFAEVSGASEPLEHIVQGLDERTPLLVAWGDGDRVTDPSGLPALAAAAPWAQTRRLEGVGHLPQVEAPRETARLLVAFLSPASHA